MTHSGPRRLSGAPEFVEWLRLELHEMPIPGDLRARVAGGLFAITLEHHHSIVLLCQHRLYGSALALLRLTLEGYIRGEWLRVCATDAQVEAFSKDGRPPSFGAMIEHIELTPGHEAKTLSTLKQQIWGALNAFTHGGGLHVQRWQTENGVEPNFDPQDVDVVLFLAEQMGALAGIGLCAMVEDGTRAERILRQFEARPSVW